MKHVFGAAGLAAHRNRHQEGSTERPHDKTFENIWQFIRDNWLSNRVFRTYDDIVEHCCHAWNKLTQQPWRIMSIGLREWAHGF